MSQLTELTCTACRADAPKATPEEIEAYQTQIPEWELVNREGVDRLERIYDFDNFVEALAFTNDVGELAEAEDHHPAILTEWGKVTVSWWTHKIKGLHINDFIAAAKTDQLYNV